MRNSRQSSGFTLIEILIALFVFSILSLLLTGGLRSIINTQSHTEASAEQISSLQMALLVTSRDVRQAVDRPILNAQGKQEAAFTGSKQGFVFTHMGYANPVSTQTHSVMQRTAYEWHDNAFWRKTWSALDQAPGAIAHQRQLLPEVTEATFEYLDDSGHFQHDWPAHSQEAVALPRAVKIILTFENGDSVTQIIDIPAGVAAHASV